MMPDPIYLLGGACLAAGCAVLLIERATHWKRLRKAGEFRLTPRTPAAYRTLERYWSLGPVVYRNDPLLGVVVHHTYSTPSNARRAVKMLNGWHT